ALVWTLADAAGVEALRYPAAGLKVLMIPNSGLFLLLLFLTIASIKRKAVVCENGLLVQGLFGTATCLWEEIDEVYFAMTGLVLSREVTVTTRKGAKIGAPVTLRKLFRLYGRISEKTEPLLLPPILEAIEQRRKVEFGKYVTLKPRGLFWNDKTLP